MSPLADDPPEGTRSLKLSVSAMTRGNWVLFLLALAFCTSLAMRGFFDARSKTVPVEAVSSEARPLSK